MAPSRIQEAWGECGWFRPLTSHQPPRGQGHGWAPPAAQGPGLWAGPLSGPGPPHLSPSRRAWAPPSAPHTENKLEKNEEAALLSWEIYLKENYLQNMQYQQKQRPEQKIQDISNRYRRPAQPLRVG